MIRDHMTMWKRWRLRRGLVMSAANRAGISQRVLADVFEISRGNVAQILKSVETLAAGASGRPAASKPPHRAQAPPTQSANRPGRG